MSESSVLYHAWRFAGFALRLTVPTVRLVAFSNHGTHCLTSGAGQNTTILSTVPRSNSRTASAVPIAVLCVTI